MQDIFNTTLEFAQQKDREDELKGFRSRFYFPKKPASSASVAFSPGPAQTGHAIYFCGNSLGLQPKDVEASIQQELKDWQDMGVGGYMQAQNPWLTYQEPFRKTLSVLTGGKIEELTVMNALTVNLHLLLLSFYHPDTERYKIIMEAGAFPSDQYALETQVRLHGFAPEDTIIEISPREGVKLIREEDILSAIDEHKDSLALVLFGGINYYTGQLFDIAGITAAAHRAGAFAGFDLAHVVGNIPLKLHDWDVDFAVWCSYK